MHTGVLVGVHENTDVSAARRAVIKAADASGLSEEVRGAAAIVATEAASNMLKHAGGGELLVFRTGDGAGGGVELIALDKGPGLVNRARCFEDGYSTAGSAGTGLGAVARLSRFCDIYSTRNIGTVLVAQFGEASALRTGVQLGSLSIAYPGEDVCGDTWAVHHSPERYRVMIADGLGHGLFASKASQLAVSHIGESREISPADVINAAHLRLKSTRGSAASVADIDMAGGTVDFAGIGNIAGFIVAGPALRQQMVSLNGTLGHELPKVRQFQYPLKPGSLVILHSDGLSANWTLEKYPGLFQSHPSVIAGVLFRDFRRTRDDVTVLVIRAGGVSE